MFANLFLLGKQIRKQGAYPSPDGTELIPAFDALTGRVSGYLTPSQGGLTGALSRAVVAAAGTSSLDAAVLASSFNVVTGATGPAGTGVQLPAAATATLPVTVYNDSRVFSLLVYPLDQGNDNINELAEDLPYLIEPGGVRVFTPTSATQWYAQGRGQAFARPDKSVVFEDFMGVWALADAHNTALWSSTAGSGTGNAAVTTVANSLCGEVTLKSASNDGTDAANASSFTGKNLGYKASQGSLVMEARLKIDAVTAVAIFVGFTDTISTTVEMPIFLVTTDIDSTATDAAGVGFDTDGTTAQFFHGGVKNDADTTPAYSGGAPTAATYVTIRVEVSSAGAVRGYINGTPIGVAVANAVTTSIALTPCIVVNNRGAAQRIVTIDYVRVEQNR